MDKAEARAVLDQALQPYRSKSHGELAALLGEVEAFEIAAASGAQYQIEIEVHWDAASGGDLRVMGAIDDGGLLTAFSPLCQSFIVTPKGDRLE